MYYNFCRIHNTLKITSAMEAGLAHHVWTLEELVGLLSDFKLHHYRETDLMDNVCKRD
jgi:hypothetical protein